MIRDLVNLIFPRCCVGCRKGLIGTEEYLCTDCRIRLPRAEMYSIDPNPMELRFWGHLPIQRAFSFLKFHKSGIAQPILHAMKYRNLPELGSFLGQWFGNELKESGISGYDLILPVPLHPSRVYKRGYNQSDYICQGLSGALDIEWTPGLILRTVNTRTQTRRKRAERWRNMAGVFEPGKPGCLKGKHILLVDDVVTTGATLIACGKAIMEKAEADALSIAALAMAQ